MAVVIAMLLAVSSSSILPEILSGPEDFEVSMAFSIINTYSVQRRLSGHPWLLLSILLVDSGGSFVKAISKGVQDVDFV